MKRARSSDLAKMQGSGYCQRDKIILNLVPRALFPGFGGAKAREKRPGDEVELYWTVTEIIQRTLDIFTAFHSFAASNSEGINPRSFSVLFNFLPPRTNICIIFHLVTCKYLDLVRKWHHNPGDSTDIIFRLIKLSVLIET